MGCTHSMISIVRNDAHNAPQPEQPASCPRALNDLHTTLRFDFEGLECMYVCVLCVCVFVFVCVCACARVTRVRQAVGGVGHAVQNDGHSRSSIVLHTCVHVDKIVCVYACVWRRRSPVMLRMRNHSISVYTHTCTFTYTFTYTCLYTYMPIHVLVPLCKGQ